MKRGEDDADYREEIQSHLEMLQEKGLDPNEARRQFGNPTRVQEEVRSVHLSPVLESLWQDLRYALRGFRRYPAFALTAIAAIALGMGAATAVFSVTDRILFRPLPYPNQERLVSFGMLAPIEPSGEFMLGPDYVEWRAAQQPFEAMTSWSGVNDCDLSETNPARLRCAQVEASFLPTFGMQPLMGRNFTPGEDRPNGPRVAILSHGLWMSRYGGARDVVGRTMSLDGQSVQIIGVLPADFELPNLGDADVLVPQAMNEAAGRGGGPMVVVRAFARLKAGVSAAQAGQALKPLMQHSLQFVPAPFRKEVSVRVQPLRDRQVGNARNASWILMGAVAAVLLIGCANVASLMLTRTLSRERELAVRVALGGGRWRLIRQSLAEGVMLSLAAGVAGCLLAGLLLRWFIAIAPAGIPRLKQATLDWRVLGFAFLVSIACGLVFGVAGALRTPRPASLIGWRGTTAPQRGLHAALVIGQIGISIMLLTGAGLLMRSLWNLQNRETGMQPDNLLVAPLVLPQQTTSAQRKAFFEELESELRRLPGVTAVAVSDTAPPSGRVQAMIYSLIEVEGRPRAPEGTGGMVAWRAVTPGYFGALGIPIVEGRAFTEEDRRPGPSTMILGRRLARRLFPTGTAVGARIRVGRVDHWYTVVGVVGDAINNGLTGPHDPEYYMIRRHDPPEAQRRATLLVRSPLDGTGMARAIREQIARMNPALPVDVQPMRQRLGELAERPRFQAMLFGLFAAIGLALAAIGLFGVLSYLVAQQRREIGVRMALGATSGNVTRIVVGQALRWLLAGGALGLAGAYYGTRLLGSFLVDVPERDPWSMSAGFALLGVAALLAAWLPSRRAAAVDPVVVLRED
jgi:putative ABC transport system permease protein